VDFETADLNHDPPHVDLDPSHRDPFLPYVDFETADLNHDPPHVDLDPSHRDPFLPYVDFETADLNHDPPHVDLDPPHRDPFLPHVDFGTADLNHDPQHVDFVWSPVNFDCSSTPRRIGFRAEALGNQRDARPAFFVDGRVQRPLSCSAAGPEEE